ncbi:MAG: hypothetical protein OXR72_00230 [Gemmatimonadota bacterium]|nr:hypothetical protein [Gemmatimonadota bacterium]
MKIKRPRPLEPETPLRGPNGVLVAAPRSGHGRTAARRIHRALRDINAHAEFLDDPPGDALTAADRPVIVVGNLADSRCVRELYFRFLSATDLWYPGPGGFELRTLCNPFGTGCNVIHAGYSDAAGAASVTDAFSSRLDDPIPHFAVLDVTRLPLSSREAAQVRTEPLLPTAWQIANTMQGDLKGYLYYLTGDPHLGQEYRRAWEAVVESGYVKTEKIVQAHLYSLSRLQPWRLVEHMDLFSEEERLAITRFIYGWAESEEGWHHVARCPRVVSMHVPRQNHELIPALALACAAAYFRTHFPELTGPERWEEVARRAYAPYGPSWKPLCDGLCHGWWMSQPVMVEYGLNDPSHGYFEQGAALRAADAALAVVNNEGWLPSAGDSDLNRQFPGPSLRTAAAYFDDGRYRFVHDLAPPERRLVNLTSLPRAFDAGTAPKVPDDRVGVTVVPVDPLLFHAWERDPQGAPGVVTTPPSAPIDRCFDKLSVRTGWEPDDDFLLIDGLGGGSHSYDDAGGILDYARLGLSLIVQEDSFVHSAPEHMSAVTVVRDGESGEIPGFAILEANETDADGKVYLRIRLKDYAGADWVREVHLLPESCVVFNDTVIANQAGDYAVEARFRTPARLVLDGREARCERRSPSAGDVTFRIENPCEPVSLAVDEEPVHLRYKNPVDQDLWKERYHTDDVVLSTFVARRAVRLEPGEGVRLTHVAQVCGPGESPVHLRESGDDISLMQGEKSRCLDVLPVRQPSAGQLTVDGRPEQTGANRVFDAGERIRAMRPLCDGSLVAGTEGGVVTFLDPARRPVWSVDLDGPVYDIGAAEGEATILAVGHGASRLTGLDIRGRRIWQTDIEREPCPWPWWELPTPAPVQVEGGMFKGEAFIAVGCGDIQIRGFDGAGRERWRQRYNEGVPGRIRVADVNGCGEPEIVVGGEVLSDTSKCRILDPRGDFQAHLDVEGWTSILTALAFDETDGRHFLGCGANRGRNMHVFELDAGGEWERRWVKRLGGRVTGIRFLGSDQNVIAGTSQGLLLCYDLDGNRIWRRLFEKGIRHLAPFGNETLVIDDQGQLSAVTAPGDVRTLGRLPGPCAIAEPSGTATLMACGSEMWRVVAESGKSL